MAERKRKQGRSSRRYSGEADQARHRSQQKPPRHHTHRSSGLGHHHRFRRGRGNRRPDLGTASSRLAQARYRRRLLRGTRSLRNGLPGAECSSSTQVACLVGVELVRVDRVRAGETHRAFRWLCRAHAVTPPSLERDEELTANGPSVRGFHERLDMIATSVREGQSADAAVNEVLGEA